MVIKNDPKSKLQVSPKAAPAARPQPKATLPAARPQLRRDELSTGRGRALRQAAEKAIGARPSSPVPGLALAEGLRGVMAPLTRQVAASPFANSTLSPAVATAAQAVDAALTRGNAKDAAVELEKQLVSLSPADRQALYDAVKPTLDQALAALGPLNKKDTEQAITSLSHAANLVGPAAVTDLAGRLAQLIPDGHVGDFDDGFRDAIQAGAGPELALATANALRAMGRNKGASDIDAATVAGINDLQNDVKDAAANKAELDNRLAQDLAGPIGMSMNPEQKKAYEAAFWAEPEHAKVKDLAASTSKALDHAIEVAGPRLEELARAGDLGAASVLLNSYEQLAKFPEYAERSIRWAGAVGNDSKLFATLEVAARFSGGDYDEDVSLESRLTNGLLADGTTALQSQLLAEHAGEPDAQAKVLAELKSIYGDYKNAKLFKKLGSEVVKFLENTEKVIKDPNSIADIAKGWDSKSPFGKATAVFSVVTGFYKAGKSAADGAYLTAASQALSASEGGLQLTAGILAAYSGAAGKAASAAKFIDKYAPIIGAVVDAIQLGRDIGELAHDPNAGEVIKALGTLVCLAGDAFPVVGGILKAGGSVIQFLGGLLDSFYEGKDKKEKLQDEQVKLYMKATGCDEASALEIVQSRSSTIDRLTQLGFSTAQIQALAKDPNVDLSSAETRVAIRAAALFGLDQAETVEFLKLALHDGKFQYDGPLTELAIVLGRPATSVAEGDQVYQRHDLSEVQRRALEQLSYDSPELAAWLEKHQGPPNYDTVFADGIYED